MLTHNSVMTSTYMLRFAVGIPSGKIAHWDYRRTSIFIAVAASKQVDAQRSSFARLQSQVFGRFITYALFSFLPT